MPFVISPTISCVCSFPIVGKFDPVILKAEKSTNRSATETRVSASALTVPKIGLSAPFGVYDTAEYSVMWR